MNKKYVISIQRIIDDDGYVFPEKERHLVFICSNYNSFFFSERHNPMEFNSAKEAEFWYKRHNDSFEDYIFNYCDRFTLSISEKIVEISYKTIKLIND